MRDAASRVVRAATADDLAAIATLGHAAIDLGEYPDGTRGDVERNLVALTADPAMALVATQDGAVVGYIAPRLNDLYVASGWRRRGHATALVEAALPHVRDVLGFPYLLLYVPPGDGPGRHFAEARGFAYRASLYWMERPADDPCPEPAFPAGVVTRPWDPGGDDVAGFVRLMNTCFADHPTPVAWTEAIVRAVHAAPDFDPADIHLVAPADEPGQPVAFCRARTYPADDPPHGEVKLIGVLPEWRGRGLGRALLRWGVRHLAGRGVPVTALAVAAGNERALRLYEAHGFRPAAEWPQWSRDV